MKRSQKILEVMLTVLWVAMVFATFMTGSFVAAGAILAAPVAVKAADITDTEKLSQELNRVFAEMSVEIKNAITTDLSAKGGISIEALDAKLKTLGLEEKTLGEINRILNEHGTELQRVAGVGQDAGKSLRSYVKSLFSTEGLLESINKAYTNKTEIDLGKKAVGNITTGNVTTDTGGNALLDMLNADELMDIRLNTPFIEDFASTSSTSKPVYTYVDYVPGEGDVDFIAEGGTKTQLDLDIEVRTESPRKAAGYEILTEESMTDIPRMESNARTILFKKYLLKRQNGILFGDGIGANPLGVTAVAALFNPLTWTGAKVVNPNLHDVVIACANQIYTTVAYTDDVEYYPNVVFLNPADVAALRLTKTTNEQYVFPSFTLLNDKNIDGIRVVAKNKIPVGKILIGDFTKLNIIDYIAYSVRLGWINDQFIKNLFTMLGEGRFFSFVKYLDQRAFLYDNISNVIAGIQKV